MKEFTEDLRYSYPLTPQSIVIDAGGYEGNFAKLIAEKYGCHVWCYEPIAAHYANIVSRLAGTPQESLIRVIPAGIGGHERKEKFGIKGDMTGITADGPLEEVQIVAIDQVVTLLAGAERRIDLLKLNVEGMEYEILEALLERGLAHRFNNIQVQPHACAPGAERRWEYIRNLMHMNHRITWDAPWCWCNFELIK